MGNAKVSRERLDILTSGKDLCTNCGSSRWSSWSHQYLPSCNQLWRPQGQLAVATYTECPVHHVFATCVGHALRSHHFAVLLWVLASPRCVPFTPVLDAFGTPFLWYILMPSSCDSI